MAESDDITARDANVAAQIEADVGVEHIADVYGEALLGAAENAGRTEELLQEFELLVTDVLERFPRLEAILVSVLIPHEEKAGILDRILGGRFSPLMINFLKVVSRHGRLDCLRAIHRQIRLLRGRVHVQLTTATPLGDAVASRIAASLRSLLRAEPVLQRLTDPELIGGAVLRVDDTVYDASIANQLHLIRQKMVDRSAHEIQSRRDRFRDPAGN